MDTLTHAVSGALLYKGWAGLSSRPMPKSAWAIPLVMLVANAPDADIFFASTPMHFLLLHRGISHALAAMPLMAFVGALLLLPLWQRNTTQRLSFFTCFWLVFSLTVLHVYLDCITTYGTMIFLPFSDYRVRLNGMFIVDLWLLVPMIVACCVVRGNAAARWSTGRRAVLLCACLWMLLYPAATVLWRMQLEGQELIALADEAPFSPTVLPDALSPLHWRILYATEGLNQPLEPAAFAPGAADSQKALPPARVPLPDLSSTVTPSTVLSPGTSPPGLNLPELLPNNSVHQQALNGFAAPTSPVYNYPEANAALLHRLSALDKSCQVFFRFTLLPLQYTQAWEGGVEYLFYDLRFNTLVPFVQKIMRLRQDGAVPFLLRVRCDAKGELVAVRMSFSGSKRDSGWQPPKKPRPPTWAEWLVGL